MFPIRFKRQFICGDADFLVLRGLIQKWWMNQRSVMASTVF